MVMVMVNIIMIIINGAFKILIKKQTYGVGYRFTMSLETNDDTIKDIDNIKRQIDKSVSLTSSELTYIGYHLNKLVH